MREILFRGIWVHGNKEWIEGDLVRDSEGKPHIVDTKYAVYWGGESTFVCEDECEVIPETVGQYTGRNVGADKLFEGDIIEWVEDYDDNWGDSKTYIGRSLVIWDNDNSCWAVKTDTYIQFFNDFSWDRCYVVGNIHDNPEMLEVK